ncbi:SMI1/KNR4 family protein [Chryseobacterium sp. PMSZPI]|uniref:SMI1/KNR4 family protein n=1 Tax=Chryseobacterium sp. PMSZPI TaxID=1033900 RepID=UPI0039A297C2
MKKTLKQLDSNIKGIRPEFYNCLNNPLEENELQKMENQFNILIPNDLKELYGWKNGQESSCFDAFVNNSMFIPLEESLDIASELNSMIGTDFEIENWWNKNWIPIFHNGGGDYTCYDLEGVFTGNKGQIIEFWHRDNDRNVIAPDLDSFFNQLNKYYAKKSALDCDEFFTIERQDGFPRNFIVE